jgi:hypothetical protein
MNNYDKAIKPYASAGDGWGDAAKEANARLIKGTLLKFADWRWTTGKEGAPVPEGTQLTALATLAAWVLWQGGKPVEDETIVRQPGGELPDRDTLGFTDQAEWEKGPRGEPKDPWANTRFVYLVNPNTAEAFTFSTSSIGGKRAVSELGDQIKRMREVYPDATPIVELRWADMPTKHGKKSRPVFKVVGWEGVVEEEAKPAPAARRLTQEEVQEADRKSANDEIPWQ